MSLDESCYCCSGKPYGKCCAPLLEGTAHAEHAEALMRSRYSGFCSHNAAYLYRTYGEAQRANLSEESMLDSNADTQWLGLKVIAHERISETNETVEFIAYFSEEKTLYQLHEVSQFEKQNGLWHYTTGDIQPDTGAIKLNRNDLCICQSTKKFKKCCMSKLF